jgi:hypothetical protein
MSEVFAPSTPLRTAVLFLVFNRPDTTKKVFEAIRQAKPPRLYVAADGARSSREVESELVEKVRQIATAVDWPCEVKTLYRDKNLGCKMAVSGGIDWFFLNEEQGIILEDDCLPNNDFFRFCEEMLERYRNDPTIGMVGGFNPLGPGLESNEYFASRNSSIWGWATWRDRWTYYDVDMAEWHIQAVKHKIRKSLNFKTFIYYRRCFDLITKKSLNTWDYQWTFCLIYRKYKTIKPFANLIKNIGTEGAHAVAEDVNHNVAHGCLSSTSLLRNDNLGYMQDEWFFKKRIPSASKILALDLLQTTGLYGFIRTCYHGLKSIKSRFA